MIRMGVDPSAKVTGWCIIVEGSLIAYGDIKPKSTLSSPARLAHIYQALVAIVNEYRPTLIICEDQHNQFATAIKSVSRVRALVELVCGLMDIPFVTMEPKKHKKLFTGSGNATKEDSINMAKTMFGLTDISEHAADAISMATTYTTEEINDGNI